MARELTGHGRSSECLNCGAQMEDEDGAFCEVCQR